MGRTSTISFEMVASTAEAMKAEGITPTTRGVRERLGSTGSMGTVSAHLNVWLERQVQHVTNALVLPPVLQKAILDFMSTELASARQVLEADLAFKKKELADIGADNNKQFEELEDKAEALEVLRIEIATHQGKAEQLEKELAAIKDDVISERANAHDDIEKERVSAEHARTELAKALLRLEAMPRLEADLNAARVALDKERSAKVAAEQSEAVAIAKLDAENQHTQELIKRLEAMPRLEADLTTVRAALDTERSAKVQAEQAAAVAIAKLDAENQRTKELIERLVEGKAINTKLQEKLDTTSGEMTSLNLLVQAGQAKLEAASKEIEDLKKVKIEKVKGKVGRPPNKNNPESTENVLQTMPLALAMRNDLVEKL